MSSPKIMIARSLPARGRLQTACERSGNALLLILMLLAGVGAAAVYYFVGFRSSTETVDPNAVLFPVMRGDFELLVTENGEIESAGVTEVISEVKTRNTAGLAILRIVDEGTRVEAGDFLVELDSSALSEERTAAQIAVNTANALLVEARNIYETALISKQEYLEGTFVQEKQTIESEMFVAEENLNRAKEYYEFSKRLAAKGYVNELQLEADGFAVEKSRKELEAAKTKLRVLQDFTRAQMLKQLESDIVTAKAKWESEKKSSSLEIEKLQDIEDQIAKCTIHAPKEGVVTYAHERDRRGGDEFVVEPGAVVRERQAIIHLPDPSQMRVAFTVNEAWIQYVKAGMKATVSPVGINNVELQGTVTWVNRYAEPTGWRQANVKDYKAYVSVGESAGVLRSGMTASVTIQSSFVADALQVPVQAVYEHGPDRYCFLPSDTGWTARVVSCGPTNHEFYVVEGGLKESELVVMNPRRFADRVKLPELAPETLPPDKPGDPEYSTDAAEPATVVAASGTKVDEASNSTASAAAASSGG